MLSSSSSLLESCTRVVLVKSDNSYTIVVELPPRVLHKSSPRELRRFLCYRFPTPPKVLHTSKLVLVNSADSLYRFLLPIPLLRKLINPPKQRPQDMICNIQIPTTPAQKSLSADNQCHRSLLRCLGRESSLSWHGPWRPRVALSDALAPHGPKLRRNLRKICRHAQSCNEWPPAPVNRKIYQISNPQICSNS
jgi:hypothetical protein